jgi:quercetin dioxygenase-like cupin family protein
MRRLATVAVLCGLLILALVVNAGTTTATAPTGSTAQFTYRATFDPIHVDSASFKLYQKDPQDVVMRQLTIAPGGDSGWHFHPGPTYVLVIQGALTNYHANDPTCTGHVISAGQGYFEAPGDIHIVRNEGTVPAVLVVTFLNVPVGGAFRLDARNPGNCQF